MKWVLIGKVSKLHGLRPNLVVHTDSDKESALSYLTAISFGPDPDKGPSFPITEASWMPKGWKVTLDETLTPDLAKSLVGKSVYALRENLKDLSENEFYLSDLEGCEAKSMETQEPVGSFIRMEEMVGGATRWWFEGQGQEFSVPAIKRYVAKVDTQAKVIWLQNLKDFT